VEINWIPGVSLSDIGRAPIDARDSGDTNFGGHHLAPPLGFEVEGLPHDPARQISAVVETLSLDPEDHFYGGGERFTRLDHVGQTVRIWQRNPYGTGRLLLTRICLFWWERAVRHLCGCSDLDPVHIGSLSNRSYTIHAAGRE